MREAAKPAAPAPAADRGDPRPLYEKGNALLFSGDGKGAIAAYREAVRLAPNDPIGFRGLGLAYELQGEKSSALRALRHYVKLAPGAPDRAIIQRRIDRLKAKK
jgi:Flp pilus assembly protein TadD